MSTQIPVEDRRNDIGSSTTVGSSPGGGNLEKDLESQIRHKRGYYLQPKLYSFRDQLEIKAGFWEKFLAEFYGTALFLLIAYLVASVANLVEGPASPSKTIMISIGFGFGLAIAINITGNISGAHHNPAVSLALWLIGNINFVEFVGYFFSQIVGSMVAAAVADVLIPGPVTFSNAKASPVSISRALFLESAGTLILIVTVVTVVVRPRFTISSPPMSIGLSFFLGHLICVPTTGAGLNPARSFGACIAAASFPGYHWIYWIGPFLASLVVVLFYHVYYFIYPEPEMHD